MTVTPSQIHIVNIDSRGKTLAIDALLGYKRRITGKIAAGGFMEVGTFATIDELTANATIVTLRNKGYIRIDLVGGDDLSANGGLPGTAGIGVQFTARYALASGGSSGTADDVLLIPSLPYQVRLLNTKLVSSTAAGTVTLRSAVGGAGTAFSSAITAASGAVSDTAATTSVVIAAGTAIYARRSDRSEVGEIHLGLQRLS